MLAEVWAILGHYSSTIKRPLHKQGFQKQKQYQRDNVLGTSTHTSPGIPFSRSSFQSCNAHF